MNHEDKLRGVLLGTALGDALGLPCEGMSSAAIERRFGRVIRFHLLGRRGFVSDDTEQSALVAQSILSSADAESCRRAFRWSLLGWFSRLPFGVGLATLRACFRIALGFSESGVVSAGNGAAMRAAVVGVVFSGDDARRLDYGRALARVTHRDPRAIEGALFVAELASGCATAQPGAERESLVRRAMAVVGESGLRAALARALELAGACEPAHRAAAVIGTSGFVLHSVPFATFCFLRFEGDVTEILSEAVSAGGDTDSIGAILGAWLGALHGERGLPLELVDRIHDGPFGPSHLRALGSALATEGAAPRYSPLVALLRNVALYPIIVAHGLRRLF